MQNIGKNVLFGQPKKRVLHRKFMRLKLCSWWYTKKTCIVRKPWWWLRNQRQQLKRDTKEWVAANSEVQMFFCWFWETKLRGMLHHHPLKSGRKTFFWQASNLLKIGGFWKKMRGMLHHHPLKSRRKTFVWQTF